MDKETTDILSKAAAAVIQQPVTFQIAILPQNKWHAWLMKKGWRPSVRKFEIRPIVLGNLVRISDLLLTINANELNAGTGLLNISYNLAVSHTGTLTKVLAIAIQNNRYDPDPALIKLINENLTPREMVTLLTMILDKLDLTNFISSIISIRGLNVLDNGERKKPESGVSPLIQGS